MAEIIIVLIPFALMFSLVIYIYIVRGYIHSIPIKGEYCKGCGAQKRIDKHWSVGSYDSKTGEIDWYHKGIACPTKRTSYFSSGGCDRWRFEYLSARDFALLSEEERLLSK